MPKHYDKQKNFPALLTLTHFSTGHDFSLDARASDTRNTFATVSFLIKIKVAGFFRWLGSDNRSAQFFYNHYFRGAFAEVIRHL